MKGCTSIKNRCSAKYVSLIVVEYYGDREYVLFKQFYDSLVALAPSNNGFSNNIDHLRHCVIEYVKNDTRLKQ